MSLKFLKRCFMILFIPNVVSYDFVINVLE